MDDFGMGYALGSESNDGRRDGGMGWGDGSWLWILVIFALLGWGGNGFGGGWGNNGAGLQGALTRADLCQDMNFGQLENGVRGIQQGICDSTFALNNTVVNGFNGVQRDMCTGFASVNAGINGVNNTLMQGFNAANVVALQNQNALQTQLADCCCTTNRNIERGFADANYNLATQACAIQNQMATNTRDIIDSQTSGTRAILDWLCAKETADLRSENQSLKLAASQQAQNNYLVSQLRPCPVPSYTVCNPFTGAYGGYAGYGNAYNSGCGCNTSCGCGC